MAFRSHTIHRPLEAGTHDTQLRIALLRWKPKYTPLWQWLQFNLSIHHLETSFHSDTSRALSHPHATAVEGFEVKIYRFGSPMQKPEQITKAFSLSCLDIIVP